MSDIYKVNESDTTTNKISLLNDFILSLDGQIDQAKFNKEEIAELYSGASFDRRYSRDVSIGHTLSDYTDWSHLHAESGYSIFKIIPDNYAYDAKNQLYFDNKLLVNKGEASSETATTFSGANGLVFFYNGSTYVDHTAEAGTEGGTAFSIMDAVNEYLYFGLETTFKGAKFEFNTRGSNYTLVPEIFHSGSSSYAWTGLTSEVDDLSDGTSNFESDGNIVWSLDGSGANWHTSTVNSQTKYWTRIRTSTVPVTTAKVNYLIPSSSVIGLLSLSSSQVENETWTWCTYDSNIYVTIRNTGATAYEGDYYITSSSTNTNLQNFFIYNHTYKLDHLKSGSGYDFGGKTVMSAGTTGGSGSAGVGKQYLAITINGITYKLLHDGTI